MKTKQATERKYDYRMNLSNKEKARLLEKNRVTYAQNPNLKEKHKKIYIEKKQKKAQKVEERRKILDSENTEISGESLDVKILSKNIQNFQDIFEDPWVKCQFCLDMFDPHFILKHIGKSKDCKSFYGEKFDVFKREKIRLETITTEDKNMNQTWNFRRKKSKQVKILT